MGCCISKCKPKKRHCFEEFNHAVQDKLVNFQQAPKTPNIVLSNKISPSPPSPPTSTSSISSFTCTTSYSNNTSDSCSSLPSSSSSVLSSKDRSFSNEFLWSCIKENPHVIRINSIKEASRALATAKVQPQKLDSPVKSLVATVKQSIPQRINGSTPQKRFRSSSPTPLSRQKSFRKEPERQNSPYILSCRGLRSPSPSRRFSGDSKRIFLTNTTKESCSKRMVATKVSASAANPVSSSLRKEHFGAASPSNNSEGLRLCLRNRETFTHRISSKIDEVAVAEALAQHDSGSIPMEDIDNPLISLDCFIFL